jgi:hypothetical protein
MISGKPGNSPESTEIMAAECGGGDPARRPVSGNQNYPVPASVDLASYRSVVIWCDRFNATFGSADLS